MNIYSVCAFGICAVCIIAVIKQFRSEFKPFLVAAASILILSYIAIRLIPMLTFIKTLVDESGLGIYYTVMIKALGIAIICQFASEICKDCGENSIANKIELAGKISILLLSVPIIETLISTAKEML
ncbi:hypothetical protein LJB90_00825 [Eubacteriales bacterium OttesenSCG-928-G02]|nr:hypothetical protein [Eubacteriales bacterium OttesenSCG-928-G02]